MKVMYTGSTTEDYVQEQASREKERKQGEKKEKVGKREEMETHYREGTGRTAVAYYSPQLSNGHSTASILSH